MSNLEAGQKLWWVPSVRHAMKEQYVTIEKVGRKWATLAEGCGYRIDIKNLIADSGDYMSPGRCYLDRDAYELIPQDKCAVVVPQGPDAEPSARRCHLC